MKFLINLWLNFNISLNYLLIPKYGYTIAALTTLASHILIFLLQYVTTRFILKFDKLKLRSVFPDFLVVVIVFILFSFYLEIAPSFILDMAIRSVFLVIAVVYIFKQNLRRWIAQFYVN